MLDYTKVTFNELDDTDKPLQVFYNYDYQENVQYIRWRRFSLL